MPLQRRLDRLSAAATRRLSILRPRPVGEIHLRGTCTKTHQALTVGLDVSPALRSMLTAMKLRDDSSGSVFKLSRHVADCGSQTIARDEERPQRLRLADAAPHGGT